MWSLVITTISDKQQRKSKGLSETQIDDKKKKQEKKTRKKTKKQSTKTETYRPYQTPRMKSGTNEGKAVLLLLRYPPCYPYSKVQIDTTLRK